MATVTLQRTSPFQEQQTRTIIGPATGSLYVVNALGQVTVAAADQSYLIGLGWAPLSPGSGPNVVLLDFGAFPGSNFATATAAGDMPLDAGVLLWAAVAALDSADHSADEHVVDGPIVSAVSDGAGNVTINGYPNNNVPKIDAMMPWGKWSVAWASLQ